MTATSCRMGLDNGLYFNFEKLVRVCPSPLTLTAGSAEAAKSVGDMASPLVASIAGPRLMSSSRPLTRPLATRQTNTSCSAPYTGGTVQECVCVHKEKDESPMLHTKINRARILWVFLRSRW